MIFALFFFFFFLPFYLVGEAQIQTQEGCMISFLVHGSVAQAQEKMLWNLPPAVHFRLQLYVNPAGDCLIYYNSA